MLIFFLHFSVGINVSSRASDRTAVSLVRKETSCCGNIQHHLFEGHFSRASLWGPMPRRHTIFIYISVACFTIKYNYGEQASKQRERERGREREHHSVARMVRCSFSKNMWYQHYSYEICVCHCQIWTWRFWEMTALVLELHRSSGGSRDALMRWTENMWVFPSVPVAIRNDVCHCQTFLWTSKIE